MRRFIAFFLILSLSIFMVACGQKQEPVKPALPTPQAQAPAQTQPTQDSVAEVGNSITTAAAEEEDLSMEEMDDLDGVLSDIEKI